MKQWLGCIRLDGMTTDYLRHFFGEREILRVQGLHHSLMHNESIKR